MQAIQDSLREVREELRSVVQKLFDRAENGENEESLAVKLLLYAREKLERNVEEHVERLERLANAERQERLDKEYAERLERLEKEKEKEINEKGKLLRECIQEGRGEDDLLFKYAKEDKIRLEDEKKELQRQAGLLWTSRLGTAVHGVNNRVELGPSATPLEEYVTESLQLLRQIANQGSQSRGFSDCGLEDGESVLKALGLREEDGNELYPIEVPDGIPECEVFDYSQYASENEGTADLGRHHKVQLQKLGVYFGRDGLQVYDMHAGAGAVGLGLKMPPKFKYKGTIDAGIAPHGLAVGSALKELRIAYQHKQPLEQRNDNRRSRGKEVGTSATTKPLSISKGQAIVEIMAAYAVNNFPLMLDLTDGEKHYLLHLKGNTLIVWGNLKPTEAYYKQSQLLMDHSLSQLVNKRHLTEEYLEQIPEELASPLKKLKSYSLRLSDSFVDQSGFLQFLPMEERVEATLQWVQSLNMPIEAVPEGIAHLYA